MISIYRRRGWAVNHTSGYWLYLCMMVVGVLSLAGCTPSVHLRANESLAQQNPMDNVVLLGSARVEWPRQHKKEAALGLEESKTALALHLADTREALKKRNYNIIFVEPMGVGYYTPQQTERWVFEDYSRQGEDSKKWQLGPHAVAYEYTPVADNEAFNQAVRTILEQFESAQRQPLNVFNPTAADVGAIQKVTGGDTLCIQRVFGTKYTKARIVGAYARDLGFAVLGTLVGSVVTPNSVPKEEVGLQLACVDMTTAQVLWENRRYIEGDPLVLQPDLSNRLLAFFPDKGQPLHKGCNRSEKPEMKSIFICQAD